MPAHDNLYSKLGDAQNKAKDIEQNIGVINNELESLSNVLKKLNNDEEINRLKVDNDKLRLEIQHIKDELFFAEIWIGVKQHKIVNINKKSEILTEKDMNPKLCQEHNVAKKVEVVKKLEKVKVSQVKEKNESSIDNVEIFANNLDFRVGLIVQADKHPDADTLYVEKIDVGEPEPRTVVSGLVAHVNLNELINRKVLVLCNLKPVKMRGILSQGMVMCATLNDKLEILEPPESSLPGDKIIFSNSGPNQYKEIKKEYFAKVAPFLKTSEEGGVAMLGHLPFTVESDKGVVKSLTLKNANVR